MPETTKDLFIDAASYLMDEKSRLALPAAFRFACSVGGQGPFVLTVGADGCLAVYEVEEWRRIQKFLSPQYLGIDRKKFARFTRFLFTRTTIVHSDPQGRIRIPLALLSFANLEREVFIVAMKNRLELWNKEAHDKFVGPVEDFSDDLSNLQFGTMTSPADLDAAMMQDAFGSLPGSLGED